MSGQVDMWALHTDALKVELQRLRKHIADLEAANETGALMTERERAEFFDSMDDRIDPLTIAAYVRDHYPAVFDQAAAHIGRIRAGLAAVHAKQVNR